MENENIIKEEEKLSALADLFKNFGDFTRIRILFLLSKKEYCVIELAKELGMTQSAISHQLKILKQNRLVKSRRDKKNIYYSLADSHVEAIISQGLTHVEEFF